MAIVLFTTDTEFFDSPDTGWPECKCSDCGKMIKEGEMPLRIFDSNRNSEYRFCEKCQKRRFGIEYFHDDDYDDDYPPDLPFIP